MKLKKIVTLLLISIMMLALAACGDEEDKDKDNTENGSRKPISDIFGGEGDEDESSNEDDEKDTTKKPVKDEEETTKKPVKDEEETTKKTDSSYEPEEFNTSVTIEETVVVDKDGVKVTANSMEVNDYYLVINCTIENNTDKNIRVSSGSLDGPNAINRYMMDSGYITKEIKAGEKVEEHIEFSLSELKSYGISNVAEVIFGLYVTDDEYNFMFTENGTIKTSLADTYDDSVNTYMGYIKSGMLEEKDINIDFISDKVLYSSEGLELLSAVYISDDYSSSLLLEFKNNSTNMLTGAIENIYVNDLLVDEETSGYLMYPGTKSILELNISYFEIMEFFNEELGIESIGKIEFDFHGITNDYDDIGEIETITLDIDEKANKFDNEGVEIYNQNDIRIIQKAVRLDEDTYDDLLFLLIVENNSSKSIRIREDGDTKVNGQDISLYVDSAVIKAGGKMAMIGEAFDSALSEFEIKSLDDVTEIEFKAEITDEKYNDIDAPVIKIKVK